MQERDDRGRAVVAAILELARQLGVKTVAEGVEYPAQVAMLREARCDLIQGYVYARSPCPRRPSSRPGPASGTRRRRAGPLRPGVLDRPRAIMRLTANRKGWF